MTKCPVDPSTGITLATSFGTSVGEESLAVVGLCKSGASLAVFKPTDGASSVVETLLPPGLFASSKKAAVELSDLSGSYGTVLVLRATEEWTSAAVTLSHAAPQGGAGELYWVLSFSNPDYFRVDVIDPMAHTSEAFNVLPRQHYSKNHVGWKSYGILVLADLGCWRGRKDWCQGKGRGRGGACSTVAGHKFIIVYSNM